MIACSQSYLHCISSCFHVLRGWAVQPRSACGGCGTSRTWCGPLATWGLNDMRLECHSFIPCLKHDQTVGCTIKHFATRMVALASNPWTGPRSCCWHRMLGATWWNGGNQSLPPSAAWMENTANSPSYVAVRLSLPPQSIAWDAYYIILHVQDITYLNGLETLKCAILLAWFFLSQTPIKRNSMVLCWRYNDEARPSYISCC